MHKIALILLVLFFLSGSVSACDATISPDKNYVVLTETPIEKLKIDKENILSAQVMTSIFGEKNQIILKPQKIGKTNMTLNNNVYQIEVSKEQEEEWNIKEVFLDEIDTPFDIIFGKEEGGGK